MTNQLYPY